MADERIIVSISFLPPIGYIAALMKAGEVVIELDETYPKQTCRNRADIYGPNGKQTLIVPVSKLRGNHTRTRDIRISYALPWYKIHRRSIEAAYRNSPFFLYYQDYFLPFFEKKYEFLVDFDSEILETLFRVLQISKEIRFTESYLKQPEGLLDLRQDLTAKHATAICPPYTQTFAEKHGFIPNLSIIDLLFNVGPETLDYLKSIPGLIH